MLSMIGGVLIYSAVLMFGLWLWQLKSKDAGIVDAGWAAGIFVAVSIYALNGEGESLRRLAAWILAGMWSLRLCLYIFFDRVFKSKKEDSRYSRMRTHFRRRAQLVFLIFFQLQAVFVVLFSIPFYAVAANPKPFFLFTDGLGLLIGFAAILGEWIADKQLAQFKADTANREKTCRNGFWRYSRHPNYFFEWLHWFAYIFLSVGSPYFVLALLGPLVMYIFLMKITGIPHTEKQAASHRADYAEYQKQTNMFFPWFPKGGA